MSEPLQAATALAREPSLAERFGLRCLCAYLFVYSFPFPLSLVPPDGWADSLWSGVWTPLVLRFASALGIEVPALPAGSGDTTFNYVQLVLYVLVALTAAALWTALPRRVSEARWKALLALHVRYVLALAMLGYGFAKVLPSQFVEPSLDRLTTTYGESSPMGLLWTFMGASRPYSIFAGALEVLGGLLLLVPRAAVLGGLCSAGVLANVVAMNLCYDVPVKLYSSHLLLMAVLVFLPDARRLVAASLGRAVPGRERFPLATSRAGVLAQRCVHVAALLSIAWSQGKDILETLRTDEAPSALAGLWEVEETSRDGAPLAAEHDPQNETAALRRIYFTNHGSVMLRRVGGGAERFLFDLDEEAHTIHLHPFAQPSGPVEPRELHYELVPEDALVLREASPRGEFETHLRRAPARSFLLRERGFHWINEFPLNQ